MVPCYPSPFRKDIEVPATINITIYKVKTRIIRIPIYAKQDLRYLIALWSSCLSRVCIAWEVCLEKRNKKRTGKKYITARRRTGTNISDSGIPRLFSPELKAVRKVPAIRPITIISPRKMNPIMARNIAHFLVVFRYLRVSCSISIFLISCVVSIF